MKKKINQIPLVDSIEELSNYINQYVYVYIREDIYEFDHPNVWYKRYLNQKIKVKVLSVNSRNTYAMVKLDNYVHVNNVGIDIYTLHKNTKLRNCINIIIDELL